MDAALQSVVESVVGDKVRNGDMFTAYDVTVEVRNRGHRERHNNIKEVVHDYFGQGRMGADYTRSLLPIPGAPVPAWLYHRHTDDTTAYVPQNQGNPAAVQSSVAGFYAQGTASAPTVSASASSPPGRIPDARGTLCIPAGMLRTAGFQPKDAAYVYVSGSSFVVSKSQNGSSPDGQYTVDVNNNVRITDSVLKKVGPKASYDFGVIGSTVVVKGK